jgi:hypothetical protein
LGRKRFLIVLGEIEDPVFIHQLVAEIELQPFDGCHDAIVIIDTAGPQQDQQIRSKVTDIGRRERSSLLLKTSIELMANLRFRQDQAVDSQPLWVKDDAIARAFQIDRPAIVSVFPLIGHERIGLLLPLPQCLEIDQGLFQFFQITKKPFQFLLGELGIPTLFLQIALQCLQFLLAPHQLALLHNQKAVELLFRGLGAFEI